MINSSSINDSFTVGEHRQPPKQENRQYGFLQINRQRDEEDHDDDHQSEKSSTNYSSNINFEDDDDDDKELKQVKHLAKSETRSIRFWRVVIGSVIFGAGVLVSLFTYQYLDQQLEDEAINKFGVFALNIERISKNHFMDMFEACRSLSFSITSQAHFQNATFPLLTVEDWEIQAREARLRGSMEVLTYNPYLPDIDTIMAFNAYANEHRGWQFESIQQYKQLNPSIRNVTFPTSDDAFVYTLVDRTKPWIRVPSMGPFPSLAVWHQSPPPQQASWMLADLYYLWGPYIPALSATKEIILGSMSLNLGSNVDFIIGEQAHTDYHTRLHGNIENGNIKTSRQAHGNLYIPVFHNVETAVGTRQTVEEDNASVAAVLSGIFGYDSLLVNSLPDGIRGIRVVIMNNCNNSFTYELVGNEATLLGEGDMSDKNYKHLAREVNFNEFLYSNPEMLQQTEVHCSVKLIVTPTSVYMEDNESNIPLIICIVMAAIFGIMGLFFVIYDVQVQKRNHKMVNTAAKTGAIVSSLFPSTFRDRLQSELIKKNGEKLVGTPDVVASSESNSDGVLMSLQQTKSHIKSYLNKSGNFPEGPYACDETEMILESKPLADLFTDTTIMFGDICGFTAWSSVREPSQVFTLLETIYRAFDKIARRRGVFKVETVGDCYVAVCGLPEPRRDHAVAMARFARDCSHRMNDLTRKLELVLGPGTADLAMRIGLHSGPVTAGVLRGQRSRFQLFGDTMNTASRMETTGQANRIHVSEETAKLIRSAGKAHWLIPREDQVEAKGKGILTTFWLKESNNPANDKFSENCSSHETSISGDAIDRSEKMERLIDWYVEMLSILLKQTVRRREILGYKKSGDLSRYENRILRSGVNEGENSNILEEVKEIIELPKNDKRQKFTRFNTNSVKLPQEVMDELKSFVAHVAAMYRNNAFHNFEHASHVAMSVVKLLSRIVAPSEVDYDSAGKSNDWSSSLHDHTYGITSDPLTQFACVFSALIHDADHSGVPNAQLVNEGHFLSSVYQGKSIAEQNSVAVTWKLLMEDRFKNLRSTIYVSESELLRFRSLVVNSVMATDIVDKELKTQRNYRWEKAFNVGGVKSVQDKQGINRKATIVIEHLIQASDVAHTMQHWHVYRKWNECFFVECYQAYKDGRANENPASYWYKGELGFFDFYIIPLAKKLKDCGVFGVSSDEYLDYALRNRQQWEKIGQSLVAVMLERVRSADNAEQLDAVVAATTATTDEEMADFHRSGTLLLMGKSERTFSNKTLTAPDNPIAEDADVSMEGAGEEPEDCNTVPERATI